MSETPKHVGRQAGPRSSSSEGVAVKLPVLRDRRVIRKSRNAPRRAIVLAIVQVIMIAHLVQWAITGRTISPIEPSESMEAVKHGVINAGAIFFAVALLSTLLLGRWFCGWGCHIVMLQDLCGWIMRRLGIHPKPFRSRLLVYVPFLLAVYMFVWPAVYRWGVEPLWSAVHAQSASQPALSAMGQWPGFSVQVTTTDFWATFPGVLVAIPFFLVCGFATVYFLGNKGFCTYGCPYGGFFAPLEQFSPGRIRVTDACEGCGHCTAMCSSNVRVHEEVREYGMVVDPGCMKCLDCVSVCPNDALYFGFGRIGTAKGPARHAEPKRRFDLTIAEEIAFALVFLVSFLAVRGVYALVPMLMAAGVAGCVTYLAWKLWRLVRDPNVNLHRFRLKYRGSISRAGVVYAGVAVGAIALTAHSGAVNLLQHLAGREDTKVTMPRASIFSVSPLAMPPEMAAHANRALRLYRLAGPIGGGGIGFFTHPETYIRQAWLSACRHDFAESERLMRLRNDRYGETDEVCRDIALLMFMQTRPEEASSYVMEVFERRPDFVQTLDTLVTWEESEGRVDEALRLCRLGLDQHPADTAERLFLLRRLSLLLLTAGDVDAAIDVFLETIRIDDTNPASFVMLSRAYRAKGDTQKALEAAKHAVELAPDRPEIRAAVADLLEGGGSEGMRE